MRMIQRSLSRHLAQMLSRATPRNPQCNAMHSPTQGERERFPQSDGGLKPTFWASTEKKNGGGGAGCLLFFTADLGDSAKCR